jgi:hypothetical protein
MEGFFLGPSGRSAGSNNIMLSLRRTLWYYLLSSYECIRKGLMIKRTTYLLFVITGILSLCYALPASAVSTLTISSSGNGDFLLQGNGMENVAAMDITITYDTNTLANPRINRGGLIPGAIMEVNPNVRGTVRMLIITLTPVEGSGTIATLAFDRIDGSPGKITALNASISNMAGKPLPVQGQIINPPNTTGSGSALPTESGEGSVTGPPASITPGVGQTIVIGGTQAGPEKDEQEEPPAEPEVAPPIEDDLDAAPEEIVSGATGTEELAESIAHDKKSYTQKSVLEHFHQYTGKESIKAFIAFFGQESLIGFNQEPPIALADGKATIKISFIAMPSGNKKPEIKVNGAVLASMIRDPDNTNTWIAELKPGKKAVSASLDVNQGKVVMEFPVIVAPRVNVDLDKSGAVTEADFKLFLRDRGKALKPHFDMNNDGKRDFVDNYIFTANYIVMKASEKRVPEKKVLEKKVPEKRVPEKKVPEKKVLEKKAPAVKANGKGRS